MAADFPASIPVIVRVLPTDMMDGAGTEADVLHNDLADEVEALATVIGVTGSLVPTTVEARITALQSSARQKPHQPSAH
jgi:Tfp pilus assembly pilus retraction ATPase PilT